MEDMVHEKLLETRRQWYAAYVDGNVGRMDHIQLDDFVLIDEAGLRGKLDQLGEIAEAVAADRWFGRRSQAEDLVLELMPLGDVVSIYGEGRIVEDDRVRYRLNFSELWQRKNGEWRVRSLHFTKSASPADWRCSWTKGQQTA
ncbi:MAG: nuclear transport factor 2 family protein [Halomonas sp.]|uniref:Nuclear transport factor 2 family protein n=1 Tax=Halomonas sulfidivorans TaxID=2733488 RepID=A0ABX7WBS5_9GAMM|nr:nuclear transport factor 2 family protein [Halomonas sulfidivorans]MDX5377804.1 nuclear transport factor 2 family protein [Halomonas sp.]QTP57848.1 nuclear transport factor 2 family protein [Halomonas sulfidivorans]